MKEALQEITEIVNGHDDYWAELGDDTYLIRFGRLDEEGNNLVLMSDLGITWEPFRAYPTPRYCQLEGIDDAAGVAEKLMKVADAYKDLPMQCETDAYQHLLD